MSIHPKKKKKVEAKTMIPFDVMPFYFFKKRWCSTINVFIFHHRINIILQKCIINLFSFLAHDTIGFSLSLVKSRHGKPHFPWFNLFSFLAHDTIGFSLSLVKSRHGKPHFPCFNQCLVGYLLELKSGRERRRRALTVSVI